jgi:glycosyltransferase involved in cell wall biosynthesis
LEASGKGRTVVAFLSPYSELDIVRGGAERHIHNLIDAYLKRPDLEVHIVFISSTLKESKKVSDNLYLHPIPDSKLPMTLSGVSIHNIRLVDAVRGIGPDIVHAQMIGAPYGVAAARLSKEYPTVLTIHTMTYQIFDDYSDVPGKIHDLLWLWLESWEARKVHRFIIVADNLRDELARMGAKNVTVITNGIEEKWFRLEYKPIPNRILCVGRFLEFKGQDVLIKAFKSIRDRHPGASLHLVGPTFGDESYINELKKLATELGLERNVRFLVDIDDAALAREYSECAVFALPSRVESHPYVLLEAMAAGRPVVATKVGGVPGMIDHGESGLLVEYGDVEGLSRGIDDILSDREAQSRLSAGARKRVSSLSWDQTAENTVLEYRHAIEEFRRGR